MSGSRPFLIVGMQRSGTSVTLARLASHPQVVVPEEEIAAAFFATAILDRSPRGETRAQRTHSFAEVFAHVAGGHAGAHATGLKTALPSREHAARLAGCLATHAPALDLIVVRRNDLVASSVRCCGRSRRACGTATPGTLPARRPAW